MDDANVVQTLQVNGNERTRPLEMYNMYKTRATYQLCDVGNELREVEAKTSCSLQIISGYSVSTMMM